jgi:hypothetical protein
MRLMIFHMILILTISLPFHATGASILEESWSTRKVCDRAVCDDVCELIKNDLERGVDAKTVTKTNILLGNNACFVIKCVIEGGADLIPVIAGATEAGCTPDVVSRCSLEAGVKPALVAQALRSIEEPVSPGPPSPEGPGEFIPPLPEPPDNGPPGGKLSPSSF